MHLEVAQPIAMPPTAEMDCARVEGLYVHVPFCFHKCHYCDFYSITRQTPERMALFVDLILAEARMWRGIRPHTVFLGGGTPTLLPLEVRRPQVRGLAETVDLSGVQVRKREANPATVNEEYCQ